MSPINLIDTQFSYSSIVLLTHTSTVIIFLLASFCGVLVYIVFYSSINFEKFGTSFLSKNKSDCECTQLAVKGNVKEDERQKNCIKKHDYKPGSRIFYNRVPKCGSTTLYTLMRKLSKINGFQHFNSKIYDKRLLDFEEQSSLIEELMNYPTPCSYDRHVFFIDFAKHKVVNPPKYINLIREPVERIISSYFYRRVVASRQTARNKTSDYWIKKNFQTCVLSADPECSFIDGQSYIMLLVPYFCGQDKRCLYLNDQWALQQAKRNIVNSYKVVGILEHMNVTLSILEKVLPEFFSGVSQIYFSKNEIHKNQNNKKDKVVDEIKQLLKANLSNEYEIYNFALERLYKQHYQLSYNVDN